MLTANALRTMRSRIQKGSETPTDVFPRVAHGIFPHHQQYANQLTSLMAAGAFLPASPVLSNIGVPGGIGQSHSCYVLPITDSIESIFDTLKLTAMVHQGGGGTGFCFSTIRPQGSAVRTTEGIASGPLSFLGIYDYTTGQIKQGGQRRGANMGTFSVWHPQAGEFIQMKQDLSQWQNFNVSVLIDHAFMEAKDKDYYICQSFPESTTGRGFATVPECEHLQPGQHVRARQLWEQMIECGWKTGEPGLLFVDRANERNPHPELYRLNATNPCGEQWLGPYESCVLGSLNLHHFWENGELQWNQLAQATTLAVRTLDQLIDITIYPDPRIATATKLTRRIGLGIMGFGSLLYEMGIAYDSHYGVETAREIGEFIGHIAHETSERLGHELGAYPAAKHGDTQRNSSVTTVAPTGTLSIIADVSGGLEPVFAPSFTRKHRLEIDPNGITQMEDVDIAVRNYLRKNPTAEYLPEHMVSAGEISPFWHIQMQSMWTNHFADNSVSKTINFAKGATRQEVAEGFQDAWDSGCLGVTVYVDESRENQPLNPGLLDCNGIACSIEVPLHG